MIRSAINGADGIFLWKRGKLRTEMVQAEGNGWKSMPQAALLQAVLSIIMFITLTMVRRMDAMGIWRLFPAVLRQWWMEGAVGLPIMKCT